MTTTHPLQVEQDRALMQVKGFPSPLEIGEAAEVLRRACGTFEPSTAQLAREHLEAFTALLLDNWTDEDERVVAAEDLARSAFALERKLAGAE